MDEFINEYSRPCPMCSIDIIYKNAKGLKRAINVGSKPCKKCTAKQQYILRVENDNWNCTNAGMTLTREQPKFWKLCPTNNCNELIGYTKLYMLKRNPTTKCKKCIRNSDSVNKKICNAIKNESAETKQKRRISAINRLTRNIKDGKMLTPNYNVNSIPILEEYAKKLGITDLQHAKNGGEFYIKELGYWVDGYSKEKNIVIEFDESAHYKNKILKEKDLQRQSEIETYLKCIFIRIRQENLI
jgi:hypothetical protein